MIDGVYLDASALVKLVAAEAESAALLEFLADRPRQVTSALVIVELGRTLGRRPEVDASRLPAILDRLVLVEVDRQLLDRAARVPPVGLRSVDAIHVATALEVRDSIDSLVTYDHRLADAARVNGLAIAAPGSNV